MARLEHGEYNGLLCSRGQPGDGDIFDLLREGKWMRSLRSEYPGGPPHTRCRANAPSCAESQRTGDWSCQSRWDRNPCAPVSPLECRRVEAETLRADARSITGRMASGHPKSLIHQHRGITLPPTPWGSLRLHPECNHDRYLREHLSPGPFSL